MFFDFESCYLDQKLFTIDNNLIELYTDLVESYEETHYISESVSKRADSKFSKIITTIISWFMSLKNDITSSLNAKMREKKMVDHLKQMREEVKNNPNEKVTVTNVWYIQGMLLKAVDDLEPYIKSFGDMKFTTTAQIENTLNEFYEKLDKWDKALEEASKQTTVMTKAKLLSFIDKEISGTSKVYDTINRCLKAFERIQNDAKIMEKRYNIVGPSILPEKVPFFRRIFMKFTSFVKRWIIKIMQIFLLVVG